MYFCKLKSFVVEVKPMSNLVQENKKRWQVFRRCSSRLVGCLQRLRLQEWCIEWGNCTANNSERFAWNIDACQQPTSVVVVGVFCKYLMWNSPLVEACKIWLNRFRILDDYSKPILELCLYFQMVKKPKGEQLFSTNSQLNNKFVHRIESAKDISN